MALDKTLFIKLYLNRLVNTLVPSEFGAEYTQSLVNDLLAFLASDSPTRPLPNQIVDQFKATFLSSGKQQEWIRFQSVLELLTAEKSPDQIANYLVFLSKLLPEETSKIQSLRILPHAHTLPGPAQDLHSSPYRPNSARTFALNAPMAEVVKPYYETVDENEILSCLSYALLGLDSKLLSFQHDSFDLPPSINTSYAQLLSDILEPALLFKRLIAWVEEYKGKLVSPIKTAFLRFVESMLTQYVSRVNRMFQNTPTSLLAVYNSLQDEIRTLRLLSYLQHTQHTLDGFEFLAKVSNLSNFGDSFVKQLAGQLFQAAVFPYYEYIEHWIVRGELVDENNEFFVSFNTSENHINDIIEFHPKKLPTFMNFDEETCSKIFQIGKTLVFLGKYCKELDWVNNYVTRYSQFIFRAHDGLKSMKLSAMQDMINRQFKEIMNYLTMVMQTKHHLFQHLLNFKSIMLMGASDFVEAINERGNHIFSEPASSLTPARLSELLTDSINTSSIRTIPAEFRNRIDARILDLSHGNVGWDVFTLEYKLFDPPLETVLNYRGETTQYMRLFNFLWSLRHYQFVLNRNYLEYLNLHKNDLKMIRSSQRNLPGKRPNLRDKKRTWFVKAVRSINLVRYRLLTFVNVLLKYLSYDMIHESFDELIIRKVFRMHTIMGPEFTTKNTRNDRKLPILNTHFADKCESRTSLLGLEETGLAKHNMNEYTIDELTAIHKEYLLKIAQCKLLNEDNVGRFSGDTYINQIFEFLEIVFSFIKSSEEFGASVVNYIYLLNLEQTTNSMEFDDDLNELHQRLTGLMKVIYRDLYVGKFEPRIEAFTKDLRADIHLRELSKML